ncbi:MAG: riboflavin synthase [Longimicrobiales bacterium]
MFTGLVEGVGHIGGVQSRTNAREFEITVPGWAAALTLGESVAVDGICLTAMELLPDGFRVQVVAPSLARTTAGEWSPGRRVNLERALRADGRLGGHFVQGHVDATGTVLRVQHAGEHVHVDIRLPEMVTELTVLHGSLAVDGVSLTVSELPDDDVARVALIPHTWKHTNLSRLERNTRVNLEGDLIGRFVVGYLKRWALPALG